MRWSILLLVLVAACAAEDPNLDPNLHGNSPADEPNYLPEEQGMLTTSGIVPYHGDVRGYYAQPATEGNYPGIVMIHEWWGLNDNIKAMAERLAAQGYKVLAVDLYNGKVATTSDEARALVTSFDQEEGIANMQDAVAFLRAQDVTTMGSIGWCFGGAQSLQLGIAHDLDATVIYYGTLVTDTETLQAIEQPVLGIFGELDSGIPPEKVREFETALNDVGVENHIYIYEGANHAFANPSGDRYKADAAEDAWMKTTAFLAENLIA